MTQPYIDSLQKKSRETYVDFLRALGLLMIILAHTEPDPSKTLFQLRTCDVPLMVFVSALCVKIRGGI
jgi:fucose 4-O-acetylase-like acetyltransferase